MTVLLVCGDRNWTDRELLNRTLDEQDGVSCVIEGAARGADTMAFDWALAHGIVCFPYPADWQKYGKIAGPIRNREMLDRLLAIGSEGTPIKVIAFHRNIEGSKGTKDMVRRAKDAGVDVEIFPTPPPAAAHLVENGEVGVE